MCSDSAGAQCPRGALVLCKLSDEILNSGQKESDRLCCSPSPSLWLRSRAQQRLRAHLYSWRSAACTSSNVLSLLRRKTDTLWAEEEKWGGEGRGGGATSSLSLSFSRLLQMLTQTRVFACLCACGMGGRKHNLPNRKLISLIVFYSKPHVRQLIFHN